MVDVTTTQDDGDSQPCAVCGHRISRHYSDAVDFASNLKYPCHVPLCKCENYEDEATNKYLRTFSEPNVTLTNPKSGMATSAASYFTGKTTIGDNIIDKATAILNNEDKKKNVDNDPVNHPSHYTQFDGVEVIQIVRHLNFDRGNAIKYIARAGFKHKDTELEDLKKAKWYLEDEITRLEKLKGDNN